MRNAHPDKLVFADLKTADAGELEADIAFKAGADLVTVLSTAGNATIIGAVKAAPYSSISSKINPSLFFLIFL